MKFTFSSIEVWNMVAARLPSSLLSAVRGNHTDEVLTDKVLIEADIPDEYAELVRGIDVSPEAVAAATLVAARNAARQRMIDYANTITARITSAYPAAEVASWPTQEAEARAVQAGGTAADAPLLSMMAAGANVSLADYAASVIAKATAYRAIVATVKAVRDETEAAIEAAGSEAEIDDALAGAKATADAKAAEL